MTRGALVLLGLAALASALVLLRVRRDARRWIEADADEHAGTVPMTWPGATAVYYVNPATGVVVSAN